LSIIFGKYLNLSFMTVFQINSNSKHNPCQHGFIKCNYAITRLVTYLECIIPLVYRQFEVDAIYFEFSNAFDPVSHALLLRKLNNYGLSADYVSWFLRCLNKRISHV
jgi:hypothetical protein